MSGQINHDRRVFLRNSVISIPAAELATIGSAFARGGSQKDPAPLKTCFPCHQKKIEARDFVFTRYAP